MKTVTAWEVKKGDRIRVSFKGKSYEMTVEWLKQYPEDCNVSFWGTYCLQFVGASEQVILLEEAK
jgi:hypothetical protein